MPRICVACSGFKDVLSSKALCNLIKSALVSLDSSLIVSVFPLSDGGEGFVDSLASAFTPDEFFVRYLEVIGPLGTPVEGRYGIINLPSSQIGVIEMAKFSGIEYVNESLRNPYNTTSHGTGQAILHLYEQGIKEIYLGLGGSATTDAGLSVLYSLKALDFEFTGEVGGYLTGSDLKSIVRVSENPSSRILSDLKITLACDVNNPMLGPDGSACVFGPQKGIKPDMLAEYEGLMGRMNEILKNIKGRDVGYAPHAGAAGGIAGGIMACFDQCTVRRGIDIVVEAIGLQKELMQADYVITGEGSYDEQTRRGKVVSKIKELRSDAIVLCGINKTQEFDRVYDLYSTFGDRSMTDVHECVPFIVKKIYDSNSKFNPQYK
jgi:glycerate 2-kinase